MKKHVASLLIIPILFTMYSFIHPYYVSVYEVEYNLNSKKFEIACKVFTDDLENAIENALHEKRDLIHLKDTTANKAAIYKYASGHLKILANNRFCKLNLLGYEQEGEATWFYFESDPVNELKSCCIINSMLFDKFKEQCNIVHFKIKEKKQSYKLDNPDSEFCPIQN